MRPASTFSIIQLSNSRVNASELSDANRAQIEDIITRKTGVAAENIVITPVYSDGK